MSREPSESNPVAPNRSPSEIRRLLGVLLDGALLLATVTGSILRRPWRFGASLEPTVTELKRAFVYLVQSIFVAVLALQFLPATPLPTASREDLELLESDLLVEGLTLATALLIAFGGVVAHYVARLRGSTAPLFGSVAAFFYYNGYLNVVFLVTFVTASVLTLPSIAPIVEQGAVAILVRVLLILLAAWWVFALVSLFGWFAQITRLRLAWSALICVVSLTAVALPAAGVALLIESLG